MNDPKHYPTLDEAFPSLFNKENQQEWWVMKQRLEEFRISQNITKCCSALMGGAFLRHLRQHLTIPLQKLGDRIENTSFVIHLARWMIADHLDL